MDAEGLAAASTGRAAAVRAELGEGPVEGIGRRVAYRALKRAFDVAFSAGVLVCLSPLMLAVAAAIKADDPEGPVLFRQERVGRGGRAFTMYKFRSMVADAEVRLAEVAHLNEKDGPVFKIADDPRVTRVGRLIRKTSVDEFPQFLNVLRGDMSVVGPRPAHLSEVAQYDDYQRQRLLVRPGITCYWQTRRNRDTIGQPGGGGDSFYGRAIGNTRRKDVHDSGRRCRYRVRARRRLRE